jgi:hypothetical protein
MTGKAGCLPTSYPVSAGVVVGRCVVGGGSWGAGWDVGTRGDA